MVFLGDVFAVADLRHAKDLFEQDRNITGAMPQDCVAQFVTHNPGQLVLAVGKADKFARNENVAAGYIESVGFGKVDDEELKLESGRGQGLDQLVSDSFNISHRLRISHNMDLTGQFLISKVTQDHLLLRRKDIVCPGIRNDVRRRAILRVNRSATDGKQSNSEDFLKDRHDQNIAG